MEIHSKSPLTPTTALTSHIVLCLLTLCLLLSSFSLSATTLPLIALTQIVEHPSLTEAKRGILDELKAQGYEPNQNFILMEDNAQGNIATAGLIAKKFIHAKPAVLVPISTPSAQIILHANRDAKIPTVFSSVSDPLSAGLVADVEHPPAHLTGVMDLPPLQDTILLMQKMITTIHTLGILYNPGEANSVNTIERMKKEVPKNWHILLAPVPQTQDAAQALRSLVGKVDAIYLPSDNTVFAALPTLTKLAKKHRLPIFTSDPDAIKQGALACAGYTQYEVGRMAGKLIVRTLKGEHGIPIAIPQQVDVYINTTTAEQIGLLLPSLKQPIHFIK